MPILFDNRLNPEDRNVPPVIVGEPTEINLVRGDGLTILRDGVRVAELTVNGQTYLADMTGTYTFRLPEVCPRGFIIETALGVSAQTTADPQIVALLGQIRDAIEAQQDFEVDSTDWERNTATGTWTREIIQYIDGVAQTPQLIDSGIPITEQSPNINDYELTSTLVCVNDVEFSRILQSVNGGTPVQVGVDTPTGRDCTPDQVLPIVDCLSPSVENTIQAQASNILPLALPFSSTGRVDGVQFGGSGGVPFTAFPWLAEGTPDANVAMFFQPDAQAAPVVSANEQINVTGVSFIMTYEQFNDLNPTSNDLGDFLFTIGLGDDGIESFAATTTPNAALFDAGSLHLAANSIDRETVIVVSVDDPSALSIVDALDTRVGISLERNHRFNLIDVQRVVEYEVLDLLPEDSVRTEDCNTAAILQSSRQVSENTENIDGLLADIQQEIADVGTAIGLDSNVVDVSPNPDQTHGKVQGVNTDIPAGLKSVVITSLSGINVIDGNFELGTGRRPNGVSFAATELDRSRGLLPAMAVVGGTWQWAGLLPVAEV